MSPVQKVRVQPAPILRESGYRVGLYTSPHLSDFRERIRILGHRTQDTGHRKKRDFAGMISKPGLAHLVARLKPAVDKYNKDSKYGPLSFFEVYTAIAFSYFKEKKIDFLVLETGLGGRLDATNVVRPLVCAITPISYEHTQRLGNTLKEIATEKAGIIKSGGSIVISAPQEKQAQEAIRKKCIKLKAKLFEVGTDIKFKEKDGKFSINGIFNKYPDLKVNLLGKHQLVNASVAVGAVEALKFCGLIADMHSIRRGLSRAVWPGRLEVIARNPWVVLDGAQNVASARSLKHGIRENFSSRFKKLIMVFGISKDKDIKGTSLELAGSADEVVLTKSSNPRAQAPEDLAGYFRGKHTYITQSVKDAKKLAARFAAKEDLILVTGSLFVVGEFRDAKS